MSSINLNVDTEFQPVLDQRTLPISVQLSGNSYTPKLYLHPNTPIPLDRRKHETFKSPFVPFDYFGWKYREITNKQSKNYITLNLFIFFSYKDIEFLFEDVEIYKTFVLPKLSRTRRITTELGRGVGLPWEVLLADEDGKQRWHKVSIKIFDISAMQGVASLATYAGNVGVRMDTKDTYTSQEKSNMSQQYILDPDGFNDYAMGDLPLVEIYEKTIEFYNKIAAIIGLESRQSWGMSTGKIVATMVTAWLSKRLEVDSDDFYKLTTSAGSSGISQIAKLLRRKPLEYLAMVDGGRAVKERDVNSFISGTLVDIDIAGCYGNGLKNQKFAVGHPTIFDEPQTLRRFLSANRSQLIPGLWTARVSWKDAPFKQDLLLSKVDQAMTTWENAVEGDENRVYDASMVLTTNSVTNASLTHDLLQIIKEYSSNQEWGWLLDNAVVENAAVYMKRHKVDKVNEKMLKGLRTGKGREGLIEGVKDWVEVDLSELMSILLDERKKAKKTSGKKSSMDVFLKLIINTTYGTIASEYFSEKGTGVSNVVVGNNITARARALAWLMAKGLHTHCSITDGGVFDVNEVLRFEQTSLDLFERLHRDDFKTNDRRYFAVQTPLMPKVVSKDRFYRDIILSTGSKQELAAKVRETGLKAKEDNKNISKAVKNAVHNFTLSQIDRAAWQHLKTLFPKLDIFSKDQFCFESKDWYTELVIHSKVDYRLTKDNGVSFVALRGMPKVWDDKEGKKVTDSRSNELFNAIISGTPTRIDVTDSRMLSQSEIQRYKDKGLLPHDTVEDIKRFYSHTPLGNRYKSQAEYKRVLHDYEAAKVAGDPVKVAQVTID